MARPSSLSCSILTMMAGGSTHSNDICAGPLHAHQQSALPCGGHCPRSPSVALLAWRLEAGVGLAGPPPLPNGIASPMADSATNIASRRESLESYVTAQKLGAHHSNHANKLASPVEKKIAYHTQPSPYSLDGLQISSLSHIVWG